MTIPSSDNEISQRTNVGQSTTPSPRLGSGDIHKCPQCPKTEKKTCKPLHSMTEEELRYHQMFRLSAEAFELGEFVSFPYAIPSTNPSIKDPKSTCGQFLVQERYGIVVALFEHYMEVVVLDTSNGSGPFKKPAAKRVKCFGIKKEGSLYQIVSQNGDLVPSEPNRGPSTRLQTSSIKLYLASMAMQPTRSALSIALAYGVMGG